MTRDSHSAEPETVSPPEPFDYDEFYGEVVPRFRPPDLERQVRRLADPAIDGETIHWGRNYLYRTHLETPEGRLDVVVKQFRNHGLRGWLRRRLGGSKAARSWSNALALAAAGVNTADAVLLIESKRPGGPSFFVTRHLGEVTEARYLLRAANRHLEAETFPEIDMRAFLEAVARVLRQMHDAGIFHRDLSIGNVLFLSRRPVTGPGDLFLVDLNRARRKRRLSASERTRDLCRLAIFRPEHQKLFLDAYWGAPGAGPMRTTVYRLYHYGFRYRIEAKNRMRGWTRGLGDWLRPRRAHAHIPAAPSGAAARDKIVWDHLSDQPHQHAGRLEKLGVRLLDAPSHLRQTAALVASVPRVVRRYRELEKALYRKPVPFGGAGICVRPQPDAPEALLAAVEDLGLDHVLLRLHPWEDDHDAEEALARELAGRGLELAFALPQNRDLVRDLGRWRDNISELAERFTPYGSHFQIGQAINRSKWGVWRYGEYLELASCAAEILRRHAGVQILGPAVIDFEYHVTASILNLRTDLHFDIVSSLLYVDRRGAPEARQLGFDTVGKVLLLKAIAETARNSGPRSWVTEVNWPLWEGPHSPAGRRVSVDEETQADYLARYYLLALTTGAVERIYWWQLVARGYGLAATRLGAGSERAELIRRPAFNALATVVRELRGSHFIGPLESPGGTRLLLFRHDDGRECVAAWSMAGRRRAVLPRQASTVVERDGERSRASESTEIELSSSVRYFRL